MKRLAGCIRRLVCLPVKGVGVFVGAVEGPAKPLVRFPCASSPRKESSIQHTGTIDEDRRHTPLRGTDTCGHKVRHGVSKQVHRHDINRSGFQSEVVPRLEVLAS